MSSVWIIACAEPLDDGVREVLQYAGYTWQAVDPRRAPLDAQPWDVADLVLVDVDGSDVDPVDVCRRLRSYSETLPVIVISGRADEPHKVSALMAGADDYLVRPLGHLELSARLRAALRRAAPQTEAHTFRFGSVTVDFKRLLVTKDQKVVDLSRREFDLLRFLVKHEGQVITRERLLAEVWGESGTALTRPIDMQIVKLRRKLGEKGQPRHILTVHRVGYRFVAGP